MKDLMKMLEKKKSGKGEMDESKMSAKMDVLKELRDLAAGQAGESVKKGMQEVSVMAPDKEGLKEGLEMAEEVVEEGPEGMAEMMAEAPESEEMEMMDDEDMEDEDEDMDDEDMEAYGMEDDEDMDDEDKLKKMAKMKAKMLAKMAKD